MAPKNLVRIKTSLSLALLATILAVFPYGSIFANPHISRKKIVLDAGGQDIGGGSQCLANFMRSAYEVSQALDRVGKNLKSRPISGDHFLSVIDTSDIHETTADLRYAGNPVDAYFDGSVILVRCDRLANDSSDGRRLVVAHELFRRMHVEGDDYEISRQIFATAIFKPAPSGDTEEQAAQQQQDHKGGRCTVVGTGLTDDGYAIIDENAQFFGAMTHAKANAWAQEALQSGRCHSINDISDAGFKPDPGIRALCPDDPKPTRADDVWDQIGKELDRRIAKGKFKDLKLIKGSGEYKTVFIYGLVRFHVCMTDELFSARYVDRQQNIFQIQVPVNCNEVLNERSGKFEKWSCAIRTTADSNSAELPRVLNAAGISVESLPK